MRLFVLRNLPVFGFLVPLFLTVVLGNLLYASPVGRLILELTGYPVAMFSFSETFSFGFFLLLFLPFLIVPPVAWLTRLGMQRCRPLLLRVPDIGRPEFAVTVLVTASYVLWTFWHGGIASIFAEGKDAISSVEARFLILKTVGLKPMIALHSVLWFFALYAFVQMLKTRDWFWIGFAIFTCSVVTACLTLLNMKWPVLIFFAALLLAAFIFSRRPYIALAIWSGVLLVAYVGVSASTLRVTADQAFVLPSQTVAREPERTISTPSQSVTHAEQSKSKGKPRGEVVAKEEPSWLARYISSLSTSKLTFIVNPFSRMAIGYPYYYHVFTSEGPICGGPFSQVQRNPPCTPTWLIYERIFPTDKQFAGRGSSPAGVHITAYALGGWPAAIIETILAAIVLGVYAGLPLNGSSTLGALFVTGAIVGYHFSQIPGEGPIIYDYGVLWSFMVLVMLLSVTWMRKRILSSGKVGQATVLSEADAVQR